MAEVADDIQTQLDKDPNFQYNTLKMGSNGRPDFNQLLGLQTTEADNSPSKTNAFYNHAFGLQQAKQTAKDKAEAQLNDWWLLNLYNISDNQLSAHISALEFAKRPLETNEPEAANEPADVNGQVTAGATAGGLSTLASAVKAEETTETQITADAPTLQEGGNEEYLKLWTDAKANANLDAEAKAFLKTVDPSIFAQELSEEQLENNKGFLSAAKILYNDENSDKSSGELSWDEHIAKKAAEEGWGEGLPEDEKAAIIAQRAEQELGEWAIDHMAKINDQSAAGLMAAWDIKEKPASVQLATLYMMQAFEHKNIDWKESPLRFAMNVATDPVNILFTVGGFILAPVTGGGSVVAAGAGVTARQGAAALIRQGVVKALQSHVTKTVLKAGVIGSLEAVTEDYAIRHTLEQAGYRKLGDNHDYTLNRTLTTAATGFVIGGALTGLGYGAGKLMKKPKPEAPTPPTTDAANEAIEETAEEVLEETAEKAAKPRVKVRADADGKYNDVTDQVETAKPRVKVQAYNKDNDVANQPEAPNAFNNAANNTGSRNSSNSITLEDGQDLDDWLVENNAEDWFFGLKKSQQKFIRARTENGKSFNGPSAQQTQAAPAPTVAAPTTAAAPTMPTPQQPTPQQPATPTSAAATEASTTPTTEASATPTGASTTQTTEASATPTGAGVETDEPSAIITPVISNPSGKNHTKTIPAPGSSWMHKVFSKNYNPIIFAKTSLESKNNPAVHLPNILANGKYIRPFINGIDDTILAHSLPRQISGLKAQFHQLGSSIQKGEFTNGNDVQNAIRDVLTNFKDQNADTLEKFSKDLTPYIQELQFEKNIAQLIEKARKDGLGSKEVKDSILQQAKDAIRDYTDKSGATVDSKAILEAIENKGSGVFRLETRQVDAMLKYAGHMQKMAADLSNPTAFSSRIYKSMEEVFAKEGSNVEANIQLGFHLDPIFNNFEQATMRAADRNKTNWRDAIPNLGIPLSELLITRPLRGHGNRTYKLEDTDALVRQFEMGYYNSYKRTARVIPNSDPDNAERFAMQIETISRNDGASKVLEKLVAAYNEGREWEGLYALTHLRYRTGRGENAIPEGLLELLDPNPKRMKEGGAHYDEYVEALKSVITKADHSPEFYGQRHVLQIYSDFTRPFRYARRFVGTGHVATPFKDDYWTRPKVREVKRQFYHALGAKDVVFDFNKETNKMTTDVQWFNPVADGQKRGFFGTMKETGLYTLRLGRNMATIPTYMGYRTSKNLLINPVTKAVALPYGVTAGVLIAAEEGTEYFTDTEYDWDVGSRMLTLPMHYANYALTPLKWGLEANNYALDAVTGIDVFDLYPPYTDPTEWLDLNNSLIPFNEKYIGDRGNLTATEAAEILSDFRDHNGYNPYDDIEPAKRRALIAQMVEDNQADPSGYDIQTLKVELTEEEKKKAKEEADAKAKADAEANGASTSPSTSGDAEATDTTPEGNSSPTLADAQNVASGAWDSVGNIFNAGANGALGSFDWMLTGKDAIGGGHLAADFKNAGSGFFNWIGDTWSDLANNRIKGGQKWLSFGLALLAAFPVMGFASAKLGALNIGGIPALIIGALTVGFGGGLINKLFKGQGNGSHVTTDVKQNTEQSVDHSGKDNTPKPPKPVPARVEDFSFKIKGKDAVLSDEDDAKTKGQDTLTYAVVQGGGKTNHVALSIVSNKDDAKKIVEQGQCTYVPFNLNPARGQTFDTTIEGVNHAGNEGKFAVFQGQDASNDPNAVCFELKAG